MKNNKIPPIVADLGYQLSLKLIEVDTIKTRIRNHVSNFFQDDNKEQLRVTQNLWVEIPDPETCYEDFNGKECLCFPLSDMFKYLEEKEKDHLDIDDIRYLASASLPF